MSARLFSTASWRWPARAGAAAACALGAWAAGSSLVSIPRLDTDPAWSVLRLAVAATFALLAIQIIWRPFVPPLSRVRELCIIALLVPYAVMIFVLPPFEAPDEEVHWMLALHFYRPHIANEPAAYDLSAVFNSARIHFRPDQKFDTNTFTVDKPDHDVVPADVLETRHQWWLKNQPYALPYAYPVEASLFSLFPKVTRVAQAELLFYLCRLASGGLLIAGLWALNRRIELPFTALFFFSLPLVIQQHAAVSADVFLNLGALLAIALFFWLRERRSPVGLAALWGLCLAMVAMKFILAGLLLLPVMLTWPALRRPWLWTAAAAVIGVVLAVPFWDLLLRHIRQYGHLYHWDSNVNRQIMIITGPGGLRTFFGVYGHLLGRLPDLAVWTNPLGWLDTWLDPTHRRLIAWSGLLALALDAWQFGPRLFGALRAQASLAIAIATVILASVFVVTCAETLIFFLTTTLPGSAEVNGVQVRHFFPIAMMVLLLPLAVLPRPASPSRSVVIPTAAIVLSAAFMAGRSALLAMDLLVRYW